MLTGDLTRDIIEGLRKGNTFVSFPLLPDAGDGDWRHAPKSEDLLLDFLRILDIEIEFDGEKGIIGYREMLKSILRSDDRVIVRTEDGERAILKRKIRFG